MSLGFDLMRLGMEEQRRNLKTTVLFREGGRWDQEEVGRLVSGLRTEVSQHPQHPQYIILWGHHSKEETLKALMGGVAYTATPLVGADNKDLPFYHGFM